MVAYREAVLGGKKTFNRIQQIFLNLDHLMAARANEMMVPVLPVYWRQLIADVTIIEIECFDYFQIGKHFDVAVHCRQSDFGVVRFDILVQLIRGKVFFAMTDQCFYYNLALGGQLVAFFFKGGIDVVGWFHWHYLAFYSYYKQD